MKNIDCKKYSYKHLIEKYVQSCMKGTTNFA